MMLFLTCIQSVCLTTFNGITAVLPLASLEPFFSGADLGPALQVYCFKVLMTHGCKINSQFLLVQRTDVCAWSVWWKIKTCQPMWSLHMLSQEMFMKSFYSFATQVAYSS